MKIRSMKASFGKLDGSTLELGGGLNIIQAPNEAGKSTWCAFIKTMLYGINTSERDRTASLSDKTKYQPWNGKAMEGTMELEHGDKEITITRSSFGRSPMKQFSAVYTGTNTQVENITAQNVGQTLTGVGRDVFERTAFIPQAGVRVGQTQELEKKLMSIVTTGDEDISYSDTCDRLSAWMRRIQYRGKGLLPQTLAELDTVCVSIDKINELNTQLAQLQNEDNSLHIEQRLLEDEAQAIESRKIREKAEKCAQYKAVYDAARSRKENLEQELTVDGHIPEKKQIDMLREEYAAFTAMAKARDEAQIRLDSAPMPDDVPKTPTSGLVPAVIIAVIALAAAAASFVFESLRLPMIICAAVLALAAAVTAFAIIRAYRKSTADSRQLMLKAFLKASEDVKLAQEEYDKKKKQIISDAAAIGISGELVSGIDALVEKLELYEKAKNDTLVAQRVWQTWSDENGASIEQLPEITLSPRFDSEQTARRLESAAQSRRQLRTQIDRALGQLNMLGDISELTERRRTLEERIRALKSRYEALELALETLQEANDDMQRRFSPALSRCAGNILRCLTGGKYTSAAFDRDLAASVREAGGVVSRSGLALSHGTSQQVYLALRLAMCHMVLDDSRSCPVILDDTLADYDDERAMQALEYLYEMSKERQIIIFTCHSRETMFIGGRDGVKVIKI